jgi:hypothetical protein
MAQYNPPRLLSAPIYCPRCGTATEHVGGMCRPCDPCTTALVAHAVRSHRPVAERHNQQGDKGQPLGEYPLAHLLIDQGIL